MKAVVVDGFGGPEHMGVRDVPMPDPLPHQVRVKVAAAGVNPVDICNRTDGSWAQLTSPCILGYDIAGTVNAVGESVRGLQPGDAVMAMTPFPQGQGGYAEYTVLDENLVAQLDASADLTAAASIPLAAGTAWEVVERLQPSGSKMLVLGASGGVGLFLLQLAAARGIRVIGMGRERNHAVMLANGAQGCVDYTSSNPFEEATRLIGGPFDSIADLVGGPMATTGQGHLRDDGAIAAIATSELDIDLLIDANQSFHGVLIRDDGDRLRKLAELFTSGTLRTHVTHVLPLEDVVEAHRLVDSGEAAGKVVLTP